MRTLVDDAPQYASNRRFKDSPYVTEGIKQEAGGKLDYSILSDLDSDKFAR